MDGLRIFLFLEGFGRKLSITSTISSGIISLISCGRNILIPSGEFKRTGAGIFILLIIMFGHKQLFTVATICLNIGYAAVIFGLHEDYAKYLDTLDFWIKVYIALYLLWRFNPLYPLTFNDFDRRVVFAAGLFMFTVTIVESYFKTYLNELKERAKGIFTTVKTEINPTKPDSTQK